MAVLVRLLFAAAGQDQAHALEAAVGVSLDERGGPPPGLMSMVVHPEGDGFAIDGVWRAEPDAHAFYRECVQAHLEGAGLPDPETDVRPVWSFARP